MRALLNGDPTVTDKQDGMLHQWRRGVCADPGFQHPPSGPRSSPDAVLTPCVHTLNLHADV
jgi:hypothetical protein